MLSRRNNSRRNRSRRTEHKPFVPRLLSHACDRSWGGAWLV